MDLTQSYQDIPLAERTAALEKLISSLSNVEQELALTIISNKHDPFAKFPTELVIRIFGNLHPYDIWSKRLVSRRWNAVLSAADVTKTALKRLTDHDPTDSALSTADSKPSAITDELRHVQSLRLGRPFSSMYFQDDLAIHGSLWPLAPIELKGRHIAYLQGKHRQSNKVVLRDLVSGQTATLHGEAREKISGLTLTSELIAFVTYTGFVYTAFLANPQTVRKATRLPSSRVRCLAGSGHIVACLLYGDNQHTVVIHDAIRIKTTSFTLSNNDLPQKNTPTTPECMVVDSAHETIDLLMLVNEGLHDEDEDEESCCGHDRFLTTIAVQRFSLTGGLIKQQMSDQSQVWHDLGDDGSENEFSLEDKPQNGLTLSNVCPAGRKGVYQFVMAYDQSSPMLYDSSTMTFDRISTPRDCDKPLIDTWPGRAAFWKDHQFRFSVEGYGNMIVMLPQPYNLAHNSDDNPPDHACGSYITWFLPADLPKPPKNCIDIRPNFTEVNDSFAVAVLPEDGVIQVLCFDERIQMQGSESTGLWSRFYEPEFARWERPDGPEDSALYHKFRAFDGLDCRKERRIDYKEPVPRWEQTKWKMPGFGHGEA